MYPDLSLEHFREMLSHGKSDAEALLLAVMGLVRPIEAIEDLFELVPGNAFAGVENASICYEEPSKFPPMDYDISVVVPAGVFYADLEHCWKNEGKGILKNTRIVDTYDTELFHSITIRFEFSSAERTLSSGEVQEIMDKVIANLKEIKVTLR